MSKVTFAGAPLWSERFRTCLDRQLLRPGAKIILYALLKTRLRLTENMARSRMHEDKSASSNSSNVNHPLRYFSERSDAITETVRPLVEIESPSDVKPPGDRRGAVLPRRSEQVGGRDNVD